MRPDEIAIELHDEGSCDPQICPYCKATNGGLHPIGCDCKDCLAEEADFRHNERIDTEGPDEPSEA